MALNRYADSHCHLNYPGLVEDQPEIIERMEEANIKYALNVCTKVEEFKNIFSTAEKKEWLFASIGVHPDNENVIEPSVGDICNYATNKKVVAIGETGLDYYRLKGDLSWQRDRFRRHIRAAKDINKPLIIHMRDATEDTLRILKEERADVCGGVMHCFTESLDVAKRAIDLNFYISISGIVTFKNAQQVKDVAKNVQIDRLLIETDSPFLAPVPFRGKTNEPSYVVKVAECIASLREEPLNTVAERTCENFLTFIKKTN